MNFNIADLYESLVDVIPDRTAIVCGETRLSYAGLEARANRLASFLRARGVGPGDHVGLYLYNGVEYLEAMIAAFKLRAVPVNINYRYVAEELHYLCQNADLVALIYQASLAPAVDEVASRVTTLKTLVSVADGEVARNAVDYEAALAQGSPARDFGPRSGDDLYVIYTGGTTGMPRGVMWRHEDVFFAGLQGGRPGGDPIARPEELVVGIEDSPGLTMLPAAPFIHGAAQWAAWIGLFTGGKVVVQAGRSFQPRVIWKLVEDEKVTTITLVGDAMARPLAEALAEPGAKYDTSSLFVIASAGAVLSRTVLEDLRARLPDTMVLNNFGASETGHQGTVYDDPLAAAPAAPRFFMDGTSTVLDEERRPVAPGSGVIGKLARRGHVPLGYYKDPEKTAQTFVTIDGVRWVIPGDLATVEADGRITVFGRGAVCINTGGEKVFPEEVEQALKAHPEVMDAVVVGVPDTRWGERVTALVQARAGTSPTAAVLDAHLRKHVAGYKVPRELHLVDEIVRHPSGKPDYRWAKTTAVAAGSGRVSDTPRVDLAWRFLDDVPWPERRRLAKALRALVHKSVRSCAPEAVLGRAADLIEQAAGELAPHPDRTYLEAMQEGTHHYDPVVFADRSAMIGHSNAFAPPIQLSKEGDVAVGTLTFNAAFEGAPGWVHGGMVAAVIDQVFGFLQVARDIPSVTGRLTVHYRKPTPLETPLRIEARAGEDHGQKSILHGKMFAGDILLAEAEALFVRIDAASLWPRKT